MYDGPANSYETQTSKRGSSQVGDGSPQLIEPVATVLARSPERGCNAAPRRGAIVVLSDPQETADNVGGIANAPDSEQFIEKAEGQKGKYGPGEYPGIAVYGIMLRGRSAPKDRRALRGIPEGD
jgi:hypothetical protein